MRHLLVLALSLPLTACVVGDAGVDPVGDDDGGGSDTDPGGGGGGGDEAGHITADQTWDGTVALDAATTIDPGVTVTVTPGTTIQLAANASLTVEGVLDVQGTSAGKINLGPETAGDDHGGIKVPSGGDLRLTYAVVTGGGIFVNGTGKATILNTTMASPGSPSSRGDFLVMNGGTLDMQHSEIGLATGDGSHCNLHFGGAGITIKIDHSTIRGVPFGLMLYAGTGSVLTNNNWDNQVDIDTQPGVQADLSGSFFAKGAPTAGAGATLVLDNLAAAPIADAGPLP